MEDEAYLEWRRQMYANRPSWTLLQVLSCWHEWRHVTKEDRQLGEKPIDFNKYMNHWAAEYAERRIGVRK